MILQETRLKGVFTVDLVPHADERGFFARSWCMDEFARAGLDANLLQCNVSFNHKKGTLRGMHFQAAPHPEAKLVRCTRGAIHDVALDLRPDSPTYLKWEAFELTADNHRGLFVPVGCAHGFQSLTDDSEVFYQMTERFYPECSGGVRWNDPAFGIRWPIDPPILAPRDAGYPDYRP